MLCAPPGADAANDVFGESIAASSGFAPRLDESLTIVFHRQHVFCRVREAKLFKSICDVVERAQGLTRTSSAAASESAHGRGLKGSSHVKNR